MTKMVLLYLTCANDDEAQKIARTLLEEKLIVCAKKVVVKINYLWKGKIESDGEVLLIMDSIEEKFGEIEKEVKKLHSYDTFVLLSTPVNRASKGVEKWIEESL